MVFLVTGVAWGFYRDVTAGIATTSAVGAGDGGAHFVGRQDREDRERDLGADALDMGEQLEPVALVGGGEAHQADEILCDEHLGVDRHGAVDRPQLFERLGRGADEVADAAHVDHRVIDAGCRQPALEVCDHGREFHESTDRPVDQIDSKRGFAASLDSVASRAVAAARRRAGLVIGGT